MSYQRYDKLKQKVTALYDAKNPDRSDWCDWPYGKNHIFWVADKARDLAEKYAANIELAQAAAILHDIADAVMKRVPDEAASERESLQLARELMKKCNYNDKEITLVVGDAIQFHDCHSGHGPKSLEGKILATADALFHIQTGFYAFAAWKLGQEGNSLENTKEYILHKLDRDFFDKISFREVQREAMIDYLATRKVFTKTI